MKVGSAQVRCHDDDRVLHVDHSALSIRQPTVVEDLEEDGHELPACLLDFVDEDDRVWLAANVFRELATLVVSNVAWR